MIYVNVYVGQTRAQGWIRLLESYGFGECVGPGEFPPRRVPYFTDNGAFVAWQAGKDFNATKFEALLEGVWRHHVSPDFMVAPDIVAGGLASLALSVAWLPKMLPLKRPVYLVVQDGMEPTDVKAELEPFAGVFVGGSLQWKLKTARDWVDFAHINQRKCHIGRMGTTGRVRAALRWGADSIDSCLPLFSQGNLERFLRGFRPTGELDLPLGVP